MAEVDGNDRTPERAAQTAVSGPPEVSRKRYFIETWGCQMNVYDSDRFAGQLEKLGYDRTAIDAEADLILLNTCSVREKSAHKMFSRVGTLRPLKQAKPGLVIGVGGCVAQQEQGRILKRAPLVDFVVGTRAVGALGELLEKAAGGERTVDVSMHDRRFDEIRPIARGDSRRVYITVVEGCNKACSFCVVPTTRGPEVNRKPEAVLDEGRAAIARGALEIELLGQNVNAYRHGDVDFAGLLRMVDRLPGLRRLRFTTSHPREFTDDVIDAMAECETVCDHLHLPVQSGSNSMLKRMYRGYDRERYLSRILRLRERIPGVALSTDIIVGFPNETDAEFDDTMRLLEEVEFDQVFAFIYSPRPFTRAAELEDSTPASVKKERLQRLFARQDVIARHKNKRLVGRRVQILVEGPSRKDATTVSGRTTDNRVVNLRPPVPSSPLVEARIIQAFGHSLLGEAT